MTQENVLYAHSTHWVKYIPKTAIYSLIGFLSIGLMLLAFQIDATFPLVSLALYLVGSVLFLLCHHLLFHLYLSEQMIDIIITNQRIIYYNDCLFTCDDEHEIPLSRIAGVEMQQHGLLQNILNYGILWFDTGGSSLDMKRSIPHVAHPDDVAEIINTQLRL